MIHACATRISTTRDYLFCLETFTDVCVCDLNLSNLYTAYSPRFMPFMRISGESKYNRHSSVEPPNERAQIDPGGPVLQALGACDWLTPVGQEAPSNAQGTWLNHEELSSTLTIASRSRLATFSSSPLPPFSVFPSFSSHPLHSFPSQVPASLFQRLTLQSILSLTYSLSFRPFALFFDTIP